MDRVDYLIGRADALRELAETIDVQSIRDRVHALSEECLQLARMVGKAPKEEQIGRSQTEAFVHPDAPLHTRSSARRKQRN